MRSLRQLAAVGALVVALSGCSYTGLNTLELPGNEGGGDGSYELKLQMRDVGDLVPNSPVRLGDVNVGFVRGLELQGFTALVTIRVNPEVKLPQNARASVGQVSLLGAKYIELQTPPGPPRGQLAPGSTMSLASTGSYPVTEDVLASTSALLNGGGLQQIRTITTELDRALAGRGPQFRDLIGQLNQFTGGLDAQKGEIVRAIDGLDRLSGRVARQDATLRGALDELPPALKVLDEERTALVNALDAVGRFGVTFDDVVQRTSGDLSANVRDLVDPVRELADSGQDLTKSLDVLGTVLFPLENFDQVFRGDYINFFATLDFSLGTLDRNFLTGTAFEGRLGAIEKALATGGAIVPSNPLMPPGGAQAPGATGDGLLPGIPADPFPRGQPGDRSDPQVPGEPGQPPVQPDPIAPSNPRTPPTAGVPDEPSGIDEGEQTDNGGLLGDLLGGGN